MEKQLTAKELKALVEELTEYFVSNLFKADEPANWVEETLKWIENHPARSWGWSLVEILDIQLQGINKRGAKMKNARRGVYKYRQKRRLGL